MLRLLPLVLVAAPLAADPAPPPRRVPDLPALPAAVAAALGEHFEYLGGEPGTTRGRAGRAAAERFWFAKVRAKTPGRYLFTYRVAIDHAPGVQFERPWPTAAEYAVPIAVGEAGAPRVFRPRGFGGAVFLHADAGDTLLIPVHVDPFRVGHRFEPVAAVPADHLVFRALGLTAAREPQDAADPPVVRAADDRFKLVSSRVASFGNRPGTATHHTLGAVLAFTAPGTFDLAGRLEGGGPARDATPFRVRPKGEPVTVVLEAFAYTDTPRVSNTYQPSGVPPGTLEARVGDRVVLDCGGYGTGGVSAPDPAKTGVAEARPFHDVPPYTPR